MLQFHRLDLLQAYLPGVELNRDQEGGSSRVRPGHCTWVGLTPTITPNVGNSNASFLLVGDCVRAIPFLQHGLGDGGNWDKLEKGVCNLQD